MSEQLLERKQAIKSRIEALSRELQPHLRAVQNLRDRISTLEDDYRDLLDKIREEGRQKK